MKVALSPEIVNTLPVHDAHVEGIAIRTSANGETKLNLRLQIRPDESLDPFIKLGVTTPIVNLRFENCWRIVSNLLGCESKAEVLFGWEVLADSDLIQDMYNRF